MSETLQESEELEKPETAAGKELRQMGWTLASTTARHTPLLLATHTQVGCRGACVGRCGRPCPL